jgi:hypothetical protein
MSEKGATRHLRKVSDELSDHMKFRAELQENADDALATKLPIKLIYFRA